MSEAVPRIRNNIPAVSVAPSERAGSLLDNNIAAICLRPSFCLFNSIIRHRAIACEKDSASSAGTSSGYLVNMYERDFALAKLGFQPKEIASSQLSHQSKLPQTSRSLSRTNSNPM